MNPCSLTNQGDQITIITPSTDKKKHANNLLNVIKQSQGGTQLIRESKSVYSLNKSRLSAAGKC